jgi:hypothetical protein
MGKGDGMTEIEKIMRGNLTMKNELLLTHSQAHKPEDNDGLRMAL